MYFQHEMSLKQTSFPSKISGFHSDNGSEYINKAVAELLEVKTDAKGKERKIYRYENMMTPYDKLKSLPQADQYLKKGISFAKLDQIVHEHTDNQAAGQLQDARDKLFNINSWTGTENRLI